MSDTAATVTTRPAVLLVFPWCLDRLGHGNTRRVLAMADYLSRHGVTLDLVYQGNPRVPSREHEFTMFRRVTRVTGWTSRDDSRILDEWDAFYTGYEQPSANFMPGTALAAVTRGLLDALDYYAVIASYAWTAPIFAGMTSHVLRVVDLHDILSSHVARSERVTGRPSPFSIHEDTERFLWQHWDVLLAISPVEGNAIAPALDADQRLLTIPHGVSRPRPSRGSTGTLVYTGSDNPSNQAAVTWLLSSVWPKVLKLRPGTTLRLVGLICDAVRNTPLAATPGVELVGFVEDPTDELTSASVCVAPYLYGSGLKIKVVEAAGHGLPLVTTSAGAEGSGLLHGTHALIADNAVGFAEAIVQLLDDDALRDRLSSAALAHAECHFSGDACYGPLLDVLRAAPERPAQSGVVPSSAQQRVRTAWAALGKPPVVVWGNGSHTRALMTTFDPIGIRVRCIVDNDENALRVSAEGVAVVSRNNFRPRNGDLIVLSSQIYEVEMWHSVAAIRAKGAHVMALYNRQLVTSRLRTLLQKAQRITRPRRKGPTFAPPRLAAV